MLHRGEHKLDIVRVRGDGDMGVDLGPETITEVKLAISEVEYYKLQ